MESFKTAIDNAILAFTAKRNMMIFLVVATYFLSLQILSSMGRSVMHLSSSPGLDAFVEIPTTIYMSNEQSSLDLPNFGTNLHQNNHSTMVASNQSGNARNQYVLNTSLSTFNDTRGSHPIIFTTSPPLSELGLVKPTNENTVIALISMGTAREFRLAERCIRSLRAGGRFSGHVILFTDAEGFLIYRHTLAWDPHTVVVQGKSEDMTPTRNGNRTIKLSQTMIYQRYKTLILKYISFYPELHQTSKYILYLDIDNVVTQDLGGFFNDYFAKMQHDLQENPNVTFGIRDGSESFISFWREKKHFQGGQFMAHRKFGEGCLDSWRTEFDKRKSKKDQPLLMNVYNHYDEYRCSIFTLPFGNYDKKHRGKHFQVFTGKVYGAEPKDFPTIVHLTGLRTQLNSEHSQRDFLRRALLLENITNPSMVENVTWEDILTPVGPKGQRPSHKPSSNDDDEQSAGGAESQGEIVEGGLGIQENNGFHTDSYLWEEAPVTPFNAAGFALERPTDHNTAIALVAMGNAGKSSYIAERCIRTIRASGNFTGFILLFTDEQGYEKKRENLSFDPKVIVIRGADEDLKPRKADGSKIKYFGKGLMIYKRFKTLVLRYLDYDSRLDDIRYALYLDVDNVVANKLSNLFDDYAVSMSKILSQSNSSNFSYFSLWKDPGLRKRNFWQGGQIMYDRYRSTGCVDAWRDQMDTVWGPQDQPLLMNVYNNFTRYGCKVFELPDHRKHFTLLTRSIVKGKARSLPTLVHITTVRAKKFMESDRQGKFIRQAMQVYNETDMMTEDVSWYRVSQPIDARGKRPKPKKK